MAAVVELQPHLTLPQLRRLAPRLGPATAKAHQHNQHGLKRDDDTLLGLGKYDRATQLKLSALVNHFYRPRKSHTDLLDAQDGVSLARSNAWLPSDGSRSKRKPQLTRQEAFAMPKQQRQVSDAVDDDSELYRLGLLYDDEHVRGSGFGLDMITHSEEPIYAVRPTKHSRKRRRTGHGSATNGSPVLSRWSSALHSIDEELDEEDAYAVHSLMSPPPEATDFPDLVSDLDEEEGEEDDNWSMVPPTQRDEPEDGVGGVGVLEDAAADDDVLSNTDAWVVLGET